jgi:hypothetical protein
MAVVGSDFGLMPDSTAAMKNSCSNQTQQKIAFRVCQIDNDASYTLRLLGCCSMKALMIDYRGEETI